MVLIIIHLIENRVQAPDIANPHETPGAQDHLLLEIDTDA
jgi:hypothetical protein